MNKKQKQKAIIKKQDELINEQHELVTLALECASDPKSLSQSLPTYLKVVRVGRIKTELKELKATPVDKKSDSDLIYDAFNKAVVSLSEVPSVDGSTNIDELAGKYESEILKDQEVPDLFKGYTIIFSLDKTVTIKSGNDGKVLSIEKE